VKFPSGVKGVIGVAGANAFSAFFLATAMPFLSRLYPPDAFGIFGIIMPFIVIVGAILPFGSDKLVLTEKSDDYLLPLIFRGFVFSIVGSLIILIILNSLASFLPDSVLLGESNILLVFLGLIAVSILNLLINWNIKVGSEFLIGLSRVIQAILTITFQYLFSEYVYGLLIGFVLGTFGGVSVLLLSKYFWKNILLLERKTYFSQIGLNYDCSNNFFGFKYSSIVLLNNANNIILPFFIMIYYGAQEAGFYHLAVRIFSLPNSVLGKYVGDRFIADVSCSNIKDIKIKNEFWGYTRPLIIISVLSCIFITIIPGNAWVTLFGERWNGIHFSIISVALWQLSYFAFSTVRFELKRKLTIGLKLSVLRSITTVLIILSAWCINFSYEMFLTAFVISSLILQILKIKVFSNVYLTNYT